VGNGTVFNNTSWIAPARGGFLIANVEKNMISYVDFRGGYSIHNLSKLSHPIMIGENFQGDWYAACLGYFNTSG